MKRGFTLGELLIVIVIVGVLASLALPQFNNAVEQARTDQAFSYLRLIRSGEKMYYSSGNNYIACANATAIAQNLSVEVTEGSFTFNVTATNTTFTANANRKTGTCVGKTISINETGVWGGSYSTAGTPCQNYYTKATSRA